jgi:prepilin-type processing-associated H-X9-DG protein
MARRRDGFTWVEMVVCILAIGMLLMLFSLLLGPRGHVVARQAQCMNNMAVNLAKAHLQFATINNRFCGYVNSIGNDHKRVSWVVPLFPYIDRQDLANAWTVRDYEWEDANQTIPSKVKHPHTYIELLNCPTNPPADEKSSPLGYVVNSGYAGDTQPECADDDRTIIETDTGEIQPERADDECTTAKHGTGENLANGVFHDLYGPGKDGFNPLIARSISMSYLAQNDGASRTIMLSENVQLVKTWYTTTEDRAPLGIVWYQDALDTTNPAEAAHRINYGKTDDPLGRLDFARPSSYHAQGVNMAFCDGHGKFISESIDYRVYRQLLTTASDLSDDENQWEMDESMY